jgi:hypothetical protein
VLRYSNRKYTLDNNFAVDGQPLTSIIVGPIRPLRRPSSFLNSYSFLYPIRTTVLPNYSNAACNLSSPRPSSVTIEFSSLLLVVGECL